jgi:hypothetical protein
MIDLETAATDPCAAIFSIGAVIFRFDKGITEEFYVNVDAFDCKKYGLLVDKDTMQWWSERPAHVIKALQIPKPVPLKDALDQLFVFYKAGGAVHPWSHGASFDIPILEHAARVAGTQVPWKYWQAMCSRTVMALLGIRNDKLAKLDTDAHNALSDARRQAQTIIDAFSEKETD